MNTTTLPSEAEVIDALDKGVVTLAFEKKDGSRREMAATRDIEIVRRLKPGAVPTGPGKATPPGLINVFDTENMGWRSFHYDNLLEFGGVQ